MTYSLEKFKAYAEKVQEVAEIMYPGRHWTMTVLFWQDGDFCITIQSGRENFLKKFELEMSQSNMHFSEFDVDILKMNHQGEMQLNTRDISLDHFRDL